jgi:hypothetical protein
MFSSVEPIGPISLKPFLIPLSMLSAALFRLSTVHRTALIMSETRLVLAEQSFPFFWEPDGEIFPKRLSTVGSILLIKLMASEALGGSGLSMYDCMRGTRRIIWLWIALALELASVPEGYEESIVSIA